MKTVSAACGLLLAFTLLSSSTGSNVAVNPDIVNQDVVRKVDLTSTLVKISNEITIENTGKEAANSYIFGLEDTLASSIASVIASTGSKDNRRELVVKSVTVNGVSGVFFGIALNKPLAAGSTVKLTVTATLSHLLEPFPAEIKQAEKQLVRYSGNLYFFSPYRTTSQKTSVSLASAAIESYTKSTKPVSKSDSTITYGPYEKRPAYDVADLQVHYENNSPFLAVTSMTRVIEVSHWGNVAVEETYDIRHTGAKLKGSFSRYDYQRQSAHSSIKSFKTVLPASAADVYYRDEIGNISTSNMREMDDAVELELRPRFPLFGGWKTHYVIGYNVPSYQYLWTDGGSKFALKMPFVDHIFDNQVVDEMVLKIILPEGSDVSVIVTAKHLCSGFN